MGTYFLNVAFFYLYKLRITLVMLIWVTKLSHIHDKTVTYDNLSITLTKQDYNDKVVAKKRTPKRVSFNVSSPTDNYILSDIR